MPKGLAKTGGDIQRSVGEDVVVRVEGGSDETIQRCGGRASGVGCTCCGYGWRRCCLGTVTDKDVSLVV